MSFILCIPEMSEKIYFPQCLYDRIFSLAVTLTIDVLVSKSNQFIFVSNRTETVNLVTFLQAV